MNNQSILKNENDNKFTCKKSDQDLADLIRALLDKEFFGVLCTQAEGKPYGSVVAFAFEFNMKSFVFGTPRETQKYCYLNQCDQVALVVDSRDQIPDDFKQIEAVTITGSAQQIEPGKVYDTLAHLFVGRHPNLKSFIDSTTTALFKIDAENFKYVTRFQKVYQWTPLVGG